MMPPSIDDDSATVVQSPYASPKASIDIPEHIDGDYNHKPIYALSGRIGRTRYLAYGFIFNAILIATSVSFSLVSQFLSSNYGDQDVALTLIAVVSASITIFGQLYAVITLTVRRLDDLNKTGWLSLVLFIPLINIAFFSYLIFAPGDVGHNKYGAPAKPPTLLLTVLSVFMLIVMVCMMILIGFLLLNDDMNIV